MKKYLVLYMLMMLTCLVSCQLQDRNDNTLLSISVSSWTFNADGSDSLTLSVQGKDWTAMPADGWLTVQNNGNGTATVLALENGDSVVRKSHIIFRSGDMEQTLTVEQLPRLFDADFEVMYNWTTRVAMSRNGRYIGGGCIKDNYYYGVFLWDLVTDEYTEYPCDYNSVSCISDDGLMVVYNYEEAFNALMKDGQIIDLQVPAEDDYYSPTPYCCSSDGSIIIGTVRKTIILENGANHYLHIPVKWVDGVPEILPYPDHGMYPELVSPGVIPRCCSADGSVIVGSEWSNTFGTVYWVDERMVDLGNDPDYLNVIEYANGDKFAEGIISYAQYTNVSSNGDYISVLYRKEDGRRLPVLINTRTGEIVINETYTSATSGVATDEGRFFYADYATGVTLTMDAGSEQTVSDYMMARYGLVIPENYYVSYISEDGKTVLGRMTRSSVSGSTNYPWYIRFK